MVIGLVIVMLGVVCISKALIPADIVTNSDSLKMALLAMPKLYLFLATIVMIALYLFVLSAIQSVLTILFLNLDYCHRSVHSREMDMAMKGNSLEIDLGDVQVKQASVQAHADADTARHLEQVYSAQEHLAQAIAHQEDRMPTLLCDEEMAKQLAEHEEQIKKASSPKGENDDETPSIKMSK